MESDGFERLNKLADGILGPTRVDIEVEKMKALERLKWLRVETQVDSHFPTDYSPFNPQYSPTSQLYV